MEPYLPFAIFLGGGGRWGAGLLGAKASRGYKTDNKKPSA
jgi:hypothetical protein